MESAKQRLEQQNCFSSTDAEIEGIAKVAWLSANIEKCENWIAVARSDDPIVIVRRERRT